MILYHGTTKRVADLAIRDGLKPRSATKSRGHYAAASHPDAVYLTNAYAPYFSMNTKEPLSSGFAVIVIDTAKLSIGDLMPDEDALEQATRRSPDIVVPGDMAQRTRHFRARQAQYAAKGLDWLWSLRMLGTCCHHGTIPTGAIVKVIEWTDRRTMAELFFGCFDAQISLANYHLCGARYRWLMQQFARMDTGHKLPEFDRFAMMNLPFIEELFERDTISHIPNPAYRP
jgi:hypothetical protein